MTTLKVEPIKGPNKIVNYWKKEKVVVAAIIFFGLTFNIAIVLGPIYQGKLLDALLMKEPYADVLKIAGMFVLIVFVFVASVQLLGMDFTKFIDPKNVFSGIGGSIGLSRLLEMIVGQESKEQDEAVYMFLNFDDTFSEILKLYKQFIADGKTCELYPVEAKFGKQLEYADKK